MKLFSIIDYDKDKKINFFTIQETAIISSKLPFFLPYFSKYIIPRLCFVIKISKVGRHISQRFAYKYYNLYSLAIHFIAQDILNNIKSQSLPWDIAVSYDASLSLGNFYPYICEENKILNINIKYNHDIQQIINYQVNNNIINTMISEISKFFTLKNGDIILFPITNINQRIMENDIINLYIDNNNVLKVKIK